MPFVRCSHRRPRSPTPEELRKLADAVQDVMLDVPCSPPQGWSNEQKVAMYAELAKHLEAECEVRPEDLIVSVMATQHADWSFGMGQAQFLNGPCIRRSEFV
jgi:Tautomerase enzyme